MTPNLNDGIVDLMLFKTSLDLEEIIECFFSGFYLSHFYANCHTLYDCHYKSDALGMIYLCLKIYLFFL